MSWKQYGGIINEEQQYNSKIGTLTANELSITGAVISRTKFFNDLDISGNIFVSEINGNTITCKNLNIQYLNITEAVINGGTLYLDLNADVFLKGQQGRIGLNKLIPSATFDISGQSTYGTPPENDNRYIYNEALNVYTMSDINKNIIARNGSCQGISVLADLSNSMINFYSDNRIPTSNHDNNIKYLDGNYTADATIKYSKGGTLYISSPVDVDISANLIINKKNNSKHLLNETAIIYDISGNSYLSPYYPSSCNAGNALTLVSNDASSNTFLNIISPNKKGACIGGGQYPEDLSRKMGVIGLLDGSNSIITPAQTIVSGNLLTRNYTTTGFNTLKPLVDNYVVDINGPVRIKDGEITNLINVPFEITDMNFCKSIPQNGIIVGSPYDVRMITTDPAPLIDYSYNILYTTNSGLKWNSANLNLENLKNIGYIPQGIFIYDASNSIITGTKGIILYSINGGLNYNQFTYNTGGPPDASFNLTKNYVVSYNQQRVFIGNKDPIIGSILFFDISFSTIQSNITLNNINNVNGNQSIKCPINACGGYGSKLITVGYNGTSSILFYYNDLAFATNQVETYDHSYNDLTQSYTYNNICVLDANIAVAVGNNIISYSLNYTGGSESWVDISFSNVIFHSVSIYNDQCGVVSGENVIYYSYDGFKNWFPVSYDLINSSGKGADFLNSKNYQNIYIKDISNFIVSNIRKQYNYDGLNNIFTQGNSIVNNLYFPNLLNYLNSSVLDISGSITITGGINFKSDLIAKNVSLNMVNGGYIYQF